MDSYIIIILGAVIVVGLVIRFVFLCLGIKKDNNRLNRKVSLQQLNTKKKKSKRIKQENIEIADNATTTVQVRKRRVKNTVENEAEQETLQELEEGANVYEFFDTVNDLSDEEENDMLAVELENKGPITWGIDNASIEESVEKRLPVENVTWNTLGEAERIEDSPNELPLESVEVVSKSEKPEELKKEIEVKEERLSPILRLLKRLVDIFYGENQIYTDCIRVLYDNDRVSNIKFEENEMGVHNYRVYKDGKYLEWDSLFEIKVTKDTVLELELGIAFLIPNTYYVDFSITECAKKKFGFDLIGENTFTTVQAKAPISLQIVAITDTSYLSKINNLVVFRIAPCRSSLSENAILNNI